MCGLGGRGATFVFLLGLTCSQSWPGPSLTVLGRRDPAWDQKQHCDSVQEHNLALMADTTPSLPYRGKFPLP